jgi:hypothetical protein
MALSENVLVRCDAKGNIEAAWPFFAKALPLRIPFSVPVTFTVVARPKRVTDKEIVAGFAIARGTLAPKE